MNSNASWEIKADPSVAKFLKRVPNKDAQRLLAAIKSFADDPYAGDISKIRGEENVWRRRVGSYRIFYEILPAEKNYPRLPHRTTNIDNILRIFE